MPFLQKNSLFSSASIICQISAQSGLGEDSRELPHFPHVLSCEKPKVVRDPERKGNLFQDAVHQHSRKKPHMSLSSALATDDGDAHTLPESWPGCIPVGYHTQQIGTTPFLCCQLRRTGVYKHMLYPPKLYNQPAAFLAWNDVSPIPIRWQIWLENVYYEHFQSVKIQIIVLSFPPWDTLSTWL